MADWPRRASRDVSPRAATPLRSTFLPDGGASVSEWRDEVVRDNDRIYTAEDNRRYYKSLSGTCMSCHENKGEFCDKCHDYVGVTPYCWDCHVIPEEAQ